MISFAIRIVISAIALLFIAGASSDYIVVTGFSDALWAALVLGLANAIVRPILQMVAGLLTFPFSCITLGLWSLVLSWLINAFLFYQVGELINGFQVKGFWPAMLGSLALSVVNMFATTFIGKKDKKDDK